MGLFPSWHLSPTIYPRFPLSSVEQMPFPPHQNHISPTLDGTEPRTDARATPDGDGSFATPWTDTTY